MSGAEPILCVDNLCIDFNSDGGSKRRVVDNVCFTINPNEIVSLVGESGSGKTLTGRAILRLLPNGASISNGRLSFEGASLTSMSEAQLRSLRGRRIGMVFQEPMVSLNPALKIGFQMTEALRLHENLSGIEARRRSLTMLEKVQIADSAAALTAYPHQFSGGMRQRIMLASALLLRPTLLIADEPTTALDALVRKEVMDLMIALTREFGTAVLLISHDLGMVAEYADRAVVLKAGQVIDSGTAAEVLLTPRHPYTQALMQALPARATGVSSAAGNTHHIECRDLCVEFAQQAFSLRRKPAKRVLENVSFDIHKAETLALVGESGSGKTTLAKTLLRLQPNSSGQIRFDNHDLSSLDERSLAAFRTRTQMVFQDPFSSLDPRMTLGQIVAEGLRHIPDLSRGEKRRRTRDMLREVGLDGDYMDRFPHELSGGQRQRVCIARSVVAHPQFIVADEPVSALDVTIQHQVLALLASLQRKYGFTCLLISHDLTVVEQMADRVAVMYRGRILELGPRDSIYDNPQHPYTLRLLNATPRVASRADNAYELVTTPIMNVAAPDGYTFYNHGSIPGADLSTGIPAMVKVNPGHFVCCVPSRV